MLLHLLSIVAPVFACAALGFIWGRTGRAFEARFVTRLVMNVGAPFLVISTFSDVTVERAALAQVGVAALLVMAAMSAAGVATLSLARLDTRTYLPSMVFHNSGNMGLPLCLFAFGNEGLSLAIVVFLAVSTMNFTVGVAIVSGQARFSRLARTPLVYAALIALALVLTGYRLPSWIDNTVHIMGGLTIPLMLLTLGYTLSSLRVEMLLRSTVVATARILLGFCVGMAVSALLGLEGVARGVVILQAAMPSAVFNYLMAARYERGAQEVAGVVVVSTALSLVTIPAVLWFVLR